MLYAIADNFDNILNRLIEKQNKDKRENTKAINTVTNTNTATNTQIKSNT
jgi:hypothetical protein